MSRRKSSLEVEIDYTGIYITPPSEIEQKYEIVMADSMRFKDEETSETTKSKMTLSRANDKLSIEFHGKFKERPITMKTRHVRADIYINLRHRRDVLRFLHRVFKPTMKTIPRGPDPTKYIVGATWIPMKGKPSTEILIDHVEIHTPKWMIMGEKKRAFLDVERDAKYNRVQMHLGIRFRDRDLVKYIQTPFRCGEIRPVNGRIEISEEYVDLLYSYLKKYGDSSLAKNEGERYYGKM
ncbi:MAG: hypothetical protein OEW62_02100 [Candidatus Bathyarchaeota archaeon]|nr:hypothetical protein [Candidatus Bathyarchaeota archaeon]MDH5746310.1 hypothetical protein [Candidatus Bathyarchaeota archaeon]